MLELHLDPSAPRRTAAVLYEQLREAIVAGRLAPGERLTPSRELAAQLGVARSTVTTVYGRLVAEGFAEGRAGGGTCAVDPRAAAPVGRGALAPRRAERPAQPARGSGGAEAPPGLRHDLRPGTPDLGLFPHGAWRTAVRRALDVAPSAYGDPAGLPELRRVLAHWIGLSRAVRAVPDQVVVTAGAQQALDLVARVLLRSGDLAAVEDPGYPPLRDLLAARGAIVAPVPVDGEGIVVDAIPPRARLVFVTPSHQSPDGVTLSWRRRRQLLAFAERHGAAVVEDDYDSEYRHVPRPLEPLHALDRSGRVVYVGTFSKVLAPSLRLGFLIVPPSLAAATVEARALLDRQPPALTQLALAELIARGDLDRHLRRTRRIYRERHGLVTAAVADHVAAGRLRSAGDALAGLHVTARLPDGADEAAVRAALAAVGVAVGRYDECWLAPPAPPGLVLGFGATPTASLPAALAALATVLG